MGVVSQRALSELQEMVADLRAEKELLKEANERLTKRWEVGTDSVYYPHTTCILSIYYLYTIHILPVYYAYTICILLYPCL